MDQDFSIRCALDSYGRLNLAFWYHLLDFCFSRFLSFERIILETASFHPDPVN